MRLTPEITKHITPGDHRLINQVLTGQLIESEAQRAIFRLVLENAELRWLRAKELEQYPFRVTCNSCDGVVETEDYSDYLALNDKCPHCGGRITVEVDDLIVPEGISPDYVRGA